ncbi:MAG TPA: hypothetical protein VGJ62_08205 [Gemmatimonadaceae bacterium]
MRTTLTGEMARARSATARAATPSAARTAGGLLLVFLMGVSSGCYNYTPLAPSPAPGTDLVLGLNDQGRVALGQNVGPAAQTIEGSLQSRSDSGYVIAVSSVSYFNGQSNRWSGEPLTINASLIQDAKERRFSRSRTAFVIAAAAAAITAFAASRGLFANGGPDKQTPNPPPTGQ